MNTEYIEHTSENWPYPYSEQDWLSCLRVLEAATEHPHQVPDLQHFKTLVSNIYKTARKQNRRDHQVHQQAHDEALLATTGRVQQASENISTTQPAQPLLLKGRHCYSCHQKYTQVDPYYHRLCPACATINHQRRERHSDLSGRIALVTGGRIKIGHATALRLLRQGAQVWVTSRFPASAAAQFAQAPDYEQWKQRLKILGLDLLHLGHLEACISHMYQQLPYLDILVNNAALTLWHPPHIHASLQAQEQHYLTQMKTSGLIASGPNTQAQPKSPALTDTLLPVLSAAKALTPKTHNSWLLELDQIPAREMLEVTVINQLAPMMLCAQLKGLMERSPHQWRWITNVTAIEGQFSDPLKQSKHAHTNAAKAGLNMLTRTSASAYAEAGILMNAVDPGWVSMDQHSQKYAKQTARTKHVPPLAFEDAAARICAPIDDTLSEEIYWGKLLKDYRVCEW